MRWPHRQLAEKPICLLQWQDKGIVVAAQLRLASFFFMVFQQRELIKPECLCMQPHVCLDVLLCFDQNKVQMCVRSPSPRSEVTFSVVHVISASLQMWWMGALCIWRTSGSSPTELCADVILLCVMWSPPWQRITFHRAAHGVLDRNVHVGAWALTKIELLLSLFLPSPPQ